MENQDIPQTVEVQNKSLEAFAQRLIDTVKTRDIEFELQGVHFYLYADKLVNPPSENRSGFKMKVSNQEGYQNYGIVSGCRLNETIASFIQKFLGEKLNQVMVEDIKNRELRDINTQQLQRLQQPRKVLFRIPSFARKVMAVIGR